MFVDKEYCISFLYSCPNTLGKAPELICWQMAPHFSVFWMWEEFSVGQRLCPHPVPFTLVFITNWFINDSRHHPWMCGCVAVDDHPWTLVGVVCCFLFVDGGCRQWTASLQRLPFWKLRHCLTCYWTGRVFSELPVVPPQTFMRLSRINLRSPSALATWSSGASSMFVMCWWSKTTVSDIHLLCVLLCRKSSGTNNALSRCRCTNHLVSVRPIFFVDHCTPKQH